MAKVIKILAGLFIVVIIGVAIAVSTFDVNQYKPELTQLVEEATGRKLVIDGDIGFKLSLIPTVVIEDVKFANASWGSKPEMLSLDKFEVQVSLMPLLSGNIQVNRVILLAPEILLETNKKGIGNWIFESKKTEKETLSDSGSETTLPAIVINDVYIENARITYKDGVTGKETKVVIENIETKTDSFDDPLSLLVKIIYNEIPIKIEGSLGSVNQLMANEKYPVDLEIDVSDAKISLHGQVAKPMEGKGLDLDISLDAGSLVSMGKLAGKELPDVGAVKISSHVSEAEGLYTIKGFKADLGKIKIGADGTIGDPTKVKSFNLAINLNLENLADLNKLFGGNLPSIGPVTLSTQIKDKKGAYQLSKLKAKVGNTDIAGDVTINLSGKRPALAATLNSRLIDLVQFTGDKKTEQKKVKKEKVFSSDPLPFESLKAVNANINISVEQIKTADLTLEKVKLVLKLNNGKLKISPLNTNVAGGTFAMKMNLDASSGKIGILDIQIDIKNFQLSTLPDFKDKLKGGKTDLNINLKGKGKSIADIMAGSNGKFLVKMGPGTFKSSSTDAATLDLFSSIKNSIYSDKSGSSGTTEIICGVINLKIKDGIAIADKGIAISTRKMNIIGSGTIDLKTEKLDINIDPQAREGVGISAGQLAELVSVGGTLAEPKAVPNTIAALKTAASVGTAIATGGLSILAQGLFDKSTADEDPCATALGIKPKEKATSTTTKEEDKSVVDKVTDTIKGWFK